MFWVCYGVIAYSTGFNYVVWKYAFGVNLFMIGLDQPAQLSTMLLFILYIS